MLNIDEIRDIIKPETDLEIEIINDPEFIEGCNYGKPRKGHKEGAVIYHIGEVLRNVDKYADQYRDKLRLITILHDTFKYKVDRTKPKHGDNHHGMIARGFAEKYIVDLDILDIIELHDEAYNAWQKGNRGDWVKAEKRAYKLIELLVEKNILHLYMIFYKCDGETGDKTPDDAIWFKEQIRSYYSY